MFMPAALIACTEIRRRLLQSRGLPRPGRHAHTGKPAGAARIWRVWSDPAGAGAGRPATAAHRQAGGGACMELPLREAMQACWAHPPATWGWVPRGCVLWTQPPAGVTGKACTSPRARLSPCSNATVAPQEAASGDDDQDCELLVQHAAMLADYFALDITPGDLGLLLPGTGAGWHHASQPGKPLYDVMLQPVGQIKPSGMPPLV